MSAIELLEKASGHLKDRAETYDNPEGERSIGAAVKAFNAVTCDGLMDSEERGWLFMAILKMVRSQQGNYKADNYEDLAAYGALMGEAACEERNGGWTPEAINQAAFKYAHKEYTLQEVIGDAVLSVWARWVAVDEGGEVWEYDQRPTEGKNWWHRETNFKGRYLNQVVPPLNFKTCIWKIKK